MRSGMKQGATVAVDACDLVHASFCSPVTADVGNHVVVIHYACCCDDIRSEPNYSLRSELLAQIGRASCRERVSFVV